MEFHGEKQDWKVFQSISASWGGDLLEASQMSRRRWRFASVAKIREMK